MDTKSPGTDGRTLVIKAATKVESLVDFQPSQGTAQLITYTRWEEPHDFVVVEFTSRTTKQELIKYFLGLGDDLEVEVSSVETESKGLSHGENLCTGYAKFDPPLKIENATQYSAEILSVLQALMTEFDNEIDELVLAIKGDKWEAKRGHSGPDKQYAILATLFVRLQKYSWESALVRFADLLNIPYETAKTRLRTARDRGFLTSPGMGSTNSQLTDKAKSFTRWERNEY